jgi:hypothetical protein
MIKPMNATETEARPAEMEREDEETLYRYYALPENRVDVQWKHLAWAAVAFVLVVTAFIYVTRAWEWWRP